MLPNVDQPVIKMRNAGKRKINGIHLVDHRNIPLKVHGRHKMSHRFKAAFMRMTPAGFKCCQRFIKYHLICQMVVSMAMIHSYMMMSPS